MNPEEGRDFRFTITRHGLPLALAVLSVVATTCSSPETLTSIGNALRPKVVERINQSLDFYREPSSYSLPYRDTLYTPPY